MNEPLVPIQAFKPRRRPLSNAMRWTVVALAVAALVGSAYVAAIDYGLGAVVAYRDAGR